MSKTEFLTGVSQRHPGLLTLEVIWESMLEDHCGEGHIPLGLSLNLESSLPAILNIYRFIRVYPSCIPSVLRVYPEWQGNDKKILSVLFEHHSSQLRASLACLTNLEIACTDYQRHAIDLVARNS